MKNTKRFLSVAVMLCLLLGVSQANAQNRNDLLLMQDLENVSTSAMLSVNLEIHQAWRDKGAKKIRMQGSEDKPGTFKKLIELDANGNIVRKEVNDGTTLSLQYDKAGNVKMAESYKNGVLASTHYFYYNRKGEVKKSVLRKHDENKEFEGFYNEQNHLVRVRHYANGMATKTVNVQYTYDDKGTLLSMRAPDMSYTYLYNNGQLAQVRKVADGETTQMNLKWGDKGLESLKKYKDNDGDLMMQASIDLEYNTAGLLARKTKKLRDANATAEVTNLFYDSFSDKALAMRADWDGGGYGYGTPVIIKWANPDADQRVIDSVYSLRLDLTPGVGQEMPEIKNMTLRLNHQLTEKEIGDVVLRKTGKGNNFYIEETLDLEEGANTIFLEVETELGKFSSGERYIVYKNPKRQIKVRDLHVLAIGVNDYSADHLDLGHVNADVAHLVGSLAKQEGRLFGKVKAKILSDQDATKQNIETAIRQIKGKAAKDDLVLIYFAGHGEEWNGNFYLKPVDVKESRVDLEASAIDNRWILEEISRYDAPTLYFMDASHEVEGSEDLDLGDANLDEVHSDFENVITSDDDIRIFMSSTSSKQKARVGAAGDKSLFAVALAEGIDGKADEKGNGNGTVTIDELSDYVSDRVLGMTSWKQKPSHVKRGIGLVPIAKVGEN